MQRSRLAKLIVNSTGIIVAATILIGCAGSIPPAPKDDRHPADPWEPLNRRISNFNDGLDAVTLKPLAKGYQAITPDFIERGIANFSNNLLGPMFIINNFLQGKVDRGFSETGRFLANSVFGIGGLFNIGETMGMETYREGFGQTLAVWGVPAGPYVIVPVLGPRTVRHATMIPLTFLTDPLFYVDDDATRWTIYGIRLIDVRARLFSAEALIEDSYDRYATIRESYLQRQEFLINDGNPPEDEDFYDDFYDEDFEDFEDEAPPPQ